jgi:tetratricopeptide (TPR) repeat protein
MRKHFLSMLVILLAVGLLAPSALAQGGMIAGRVLDDETEEPLANVSITLENPDANPSRIDQITDESGGFTVLGMASGAWTLTLELEGFSPDLGTMRIRQGRNPDLKLYLTRLRHPLELALGEEAFEGLDPAAIGDELTAADAAYGNEEWDAALSGYDSVFAKIPAMVDLHLKRGNTLQQMERYEEAIEAFQAAATANPQLQNQIDAAVGRLRMAMGDYEAAGEALLAGAGGGSKEDLYNLGEIEFAKGDVDAAAEWYEKASAADPEWALPLFKLALVALNKGDIPGAKQFFAQVVEKDPDSSEGAQAKATLDALP